jgi:hypothetical protein
MTTTLTALDQWLELRAWFDEETGPARSGLIVEATVPEGGHIEAHEPPEPFLIPTVLEISVPEGVTPGPVHYPDPEERRFEWSPTVLQVLAGTIRFSVPLSIEPGAVPGNVTIRLNYQGCIDGACLPPNSQTVELALRG